MADDDPVTMEAENAVQALKARLAKSPLDWQLPNTSIEATAELTRIRFELTAIRKQIARIARRTK